MRRIYATLGIIASALTMVILAQNAQAQTAQADGFSNTVRVRAEYFLYDDDEATAKRKIAQTLDKAKASGADTIDTEVVWATVDQGDWGGAPRTYDWAYLDYLISQAEARGLEVNLMLTTTPDWVHPNLKSTVSNAEARRWTAPRGSVELGHYTNFVRDVSARYKGRIGHYEIWNEQNHTPFWRSGPNVGEYAALLRTAYFTINQNDPGAEVMFGGLALNNVGYVEAYYRYVKANYPDAANNGYFFDVMGVHPYVYPNRPDLSPDRYTQEVVGPLDDANYDFIGTVDGNFLGFKKIKATMDAQGDTGKNLFFSEFGYELRDGVITDSRRAFYLKRAYELAMETPYVEGMSWYAFRSTRFADPASWTLVDQNLNPTRTYRAFAETFSSSLRTAATRPMVAVDFTVGQNGQYVVSSRISGFSNAEVSSWELYRDGEMIRQGAGGRAFSASFGKADLEGHRFMLAAYTTNGSVWHSGPQAFRPSTRANTAPAIANARPGGGVKDRTPVVRATVRDAEQNLTKSNIKVYRDGKAVGRFGYDAATDTLTFSTGKLSYGTHRVRITANDGVGLSQSKVVSFKVVR